MSQLPSPKWHLDHFSRICSAHERDQQTDRHTHALTDHATLSIGIAHVLCNAAIANACDAALANMD